MALRPTWNLLEHDDDAVVLDLHLGLLGFNFFVQATACETVGLAVEARPPR